MDPLSLDPSPWPRCALVRGRQGRVPQMARSENTERTSTEYSAWRSVAGESGFVLAADENDYAPMKRAKSSETLPRNLQMRNSKDRALGLVRQAENFPAVR